MTLHHSLGSHPVAVIGFSAFFADAKNVEEFWNNVLLGKDCIREVPESHWLAEDYFDPDRSVADKTYSTRGGFIPEIDFDPMEFGLPPNLLEVTDNAQLLSLVAARDAFTHAGYGGEAFPDMLRDRTGVVLGVGGGQKLMVSLTARLQHPVWEKALRASGVDEAAIPGIIDKMKKAYVPWNENSFPGLLGNVIAGRIANRFDLGGINSVVDAACASSLSALKMSLSELVEGRADMMLTGGVDLDNSPFMYLSFSKTPAFSPSGRIQPFSDQADGMLIGEGIGMVVLKRLADAERDGDTVYAVIKGIGSSSDGRYKSIYAPRPTGQAKAMRRAYEDAGFEAKTVGLVEAHGTGTVAGDASELTSMGMVFGENNPETQHIALGSVKSQIGHTKSAAGAAGLVKAVLALHHKILPPTIQVDRPTSKVELSSSPFYINTEARPWLAGAHPRRASVSAFGFGGVNVHVALEEWEKAPQGRYRVHQPYRSILLHAQDPSELISRCEQELRGLQSADAEQRYLQMVQGMDRSIPPMSARLGFVATDVSSAIERLQIAVKHIAAGASEWVHPKGIYYRQQGMDVTGKIVALFPGQGTQYVGMGRELVNAFPHMREVFEGQDRIFKAAGRESLSGVTFPIPTFTEAELGVQQERLTRTENAQPAIAALSMGMYKILEKAGFQPDMVAGHSFGELTALWASGVYDDAAFLALAKARGEAMSARAPQTDSGMLAVKASLKEVKDSLSLLSGVSIANVNSDRQTILGGSREALASARTLLEQKGLSVIPLAVSAAFHTEFVAHAQKPFAAFIAGQNFTSPSIPVFSNTTAKPYPEDAKGIQDILQGQLLKPVFFKQQIESIHRAGGRIFVEIGPKNVLTRLVGDILSSREHVAIALNPSGRTAGRKGKDSDLQLRQAVLHLRVLGVPLGELDPHLSPLKRSTARSKMTVPINGANFVSTATRNAYRDALNGGRVNRGALGPTPDFEEEHMNKEVIEKLESALALIANQQRESLDTLKKLLEEHGRQSQMLSDWISQQQENQVQNGLAHGAESSRGAVNRMQDHPVAAVSAASGPSVVVELPSVGQSAPAPVAAPAGLVTSSGENPNKLTEVLLVAIADQTGYPESILELDMELEADLGLKLEERSKIVNSIAQRQTKPMLVPPQELQEVGTIGELQDLLHSKGFNDVVITRPSAPQPPPKISAGSGVSGGLARSTSVPGPSAEPTATGGPGRAKLVDILVSVVAEKTGYPAEMLELGMDMEADLGIDSIKRVEIFGAMTEKYAGFSVLDPQELSELRTLEEIVDFLEVKAGGASSSSSAVTPVTVAVTESIAPISSMAPVTPSAPVVPAMPETSVPQKGQQPASQDGAFGDALLAVVADKTGYPTEMLELSMDLEADLGIDSIKRVEILGAIAENDPDVAGLDPQELAELRTLGEIVQRFEAHLVAKKKRS